MAIWPSRLGLVVGVVWSAGDGGLVVVLVDSVSLSLSFGRMRLTRNSLVTPRDRDPITARGPRYVSWSLCWRRCERLM